MNDYINTLLSKFRTWKEAREIKNSTPLSAESAYTLSAINKETTLEVLYDEFKKRVLSKIKETAKYNNTELYLEYPDFITARHKEQLIEDLQGLKYKVPYISKRSILINWEAE